MSHVRHLLVNRPRMLIAAGIGLALGLALPQEIQTVTRLLAGWNGAVWSYLLLMTSLLLRSDHKRVAAIAQQEDKTAVAVLLIVCVAAMFSLAAVVMELGAIKDIPADRRALRYGLVAMTLIGSWFLVGVVFTIHYARLFYSAPANVRPLHFPNDEKAPDYWDFLYFSFTIAVAVQTSDVSVQTRGMRKVVLAQSVLCFVFNTAVIGLTINLAAGIIGS